MERNVLADRLKGYACFLVLFGHVIMGIRLAGVEVPSFLHGLELFIWSFHVSLFLFLSGSVYKMTGGWQSKKTKVRFIRHKLITLGVPYVVFSTVYILINSIAPGVNTEFSLFDILMIWKTPVAQYWYLYALFFLFVIWTVASGYLRNWQITLLIFILGYAVPLIGGSFGFFDVVIYSAFAFGLGTCVNVSDLTKPSAIVRTGSIVLHMILGIVTVKLGIIEKSGVTEIMTIVGIYASVCLIFYCQKLKPFAVFLDFMNKHSFQIYLLHTIFTAGIRVILLRLGIDGWIIHTVIGCVVGFGFSVLASVIAKKTVFLNRCFFPLSR